MQKRAYSHSMEFHSTTNWISCQVFVGIYPGFFIYIVKTLGRCFSAARGCEKAFCSTHFYSLLFYSFLFPSFLFPSILFSSLQGTFGIHLASTLSEKYADTNNFYFENEKTIAKCLSALRWFCFILITVAAHLPAIFLQPAQVSFSFCPLPTRPPQPAGPGLPPPRAARWSCCPSSTAPM